MSDVQEQIEWWKRQRCQSAGCQLESEVPGFMHTVESLLAKNKLLEKQHEYSGTQDCLDRIERLERVLYAAKKHRIRDQSGELRRAIAACKSKEAT